MPQQTQTKIKYTPVAEREVEQKAPEAPENAPTQKKEGGGILGALKNLTGAFTGFSKPKRTPPIAPNFGQKPQEETVAQPSPEVPSAIEAPKPKRPIYTPVAERKDTGRVPTYIPVSERQEVISKKDDLPFTQKQLEHATRPKLPKQKNIFTFLGNALLSEEETEGDVVRPQMPTFEQLQNPRIREAYATYIEEQVDKPLAKRVANAWDVWKDFSQDLLREQDRANRNLVAGLGRVGAQGFRALEWQGVDAAAPVADKINAWVETIEPENQRFGDALMQGLGSSLPFFVSGMGIMKGAQALGRVSPMAARIFGGGTATFLESAVEAGGVYEANMEMPLKEGENEEAREARATRSADRTFLANAFAIGITNHFGIFNTGVRNALKRVLLSAPLEGLQESYQQAVSNVNTERPWHEGVIESGIIGAIIGGIFGGVAGMREHSNVVPAGTRTYGEAQLDIKSSEAFDIDAAIDNGTINTTDVYADPNTKVLTEQFADGRIADVALKLDRFEPGLGAELRAEVDPKSTTYKNIIDTGLRVLDAATGNNIEAQIESDTTAVLPPRGEEAAEAQVEQAPEEEAAPVIPEEEETEVAPVQEKEVQDTPPVREEAAPEVKEEPTPAPQEEVKVPRSTTPLNEEVADVPESVQREAQSDWEANYAERSGRLETERGQILADLKEAKAAERKALNTKLDKVVDELGQIEDEFVSKWRKATQKATRKNATQVVELDEATLSRGEEVELPSLSERENEAVNKARRTGGVFGVGEGNLASAKSEGSKNINDLIERFKKDTTVEVGPDGKPIAKVPEDFKISKKAQELIEELTGSDVREKKLSKRFAGLYKGGSDTIRVQAIYDITTLIHEATHAIDRKSGTINNLRKDMSVEATNAKKELQRAYKALYPAPSESASKEVQLREGLAVIIENYFYDPAGTAAQFPSLIEAFLAPEGVAYDPKYSELLQRVETLVGEYANLTPAERIASRIRTGKEVVERDTGFSIAQRFIYEAFDIAEPLRRYAKRAGVSETWDDPTVQMFNLIDKNAIVAQWVKGNLRPLLQKDGNYKFNKGSVGDYLALAVFGDTKKGISWWKKFGQNQGIEELLTDTRLKEFRAYLISRRVVEMHNRIVDLKNAEAIYEDEIFSLKTKLKEEGLTQKREKELRRDLKKGEALLENVKQERQEIEEVMKKDQFSLQDAYAVVRENEEKFAKATAAYDKINRDLLDLSVNTGLISQEKAEEYKAEQGYTSFRRFVDDKLANATVGTVSTASKGNVSSFKHRTGSNLDIIDPFYSQIFAINEVVRKGYENLLWQKVANLADKNPEMARRFEKVETIVAIDGNGQPFYPQLNDPSAIGVLRDGKRTFYQAGPEFIAVAKQFRSNELDLFAALLRIPASLFTRMTTTAFPLFAATNFTIDQFAAAAQTKTGFKPVIEPAVSAVEYVKEMFGKDEGFIERYKALGGTQLNFARAYDLSPEDISKSLLKQDTKAQKVANVVDSGLDILELPTNTAELLTRFSEFKRAHDKGQPLSVAMYRASEVSVPFQMRGNIGGRAGQAYVRGIPYLNALLQVLYKFGRATAANPARVSTVAASILTSGIAFAIWALTSATDRQRRTFANLPARELARAIYVPLPDGENLLRIRVPEQFGSITGIAMLYVIDKYGYNPTTLRDFHTAGTAWLPDPINFTDPGKMAASLLPQVIKPTAQAGLNVKTYPEIRPIVPDYLKDAKKSEQYTSYTSDVAKWLGKMFNASPLIIDYWLSQQFGRAPQVLLGKVPNAPITTAEKDFVMSGRAYNTFYNDRAILELQYDKIRQAKTPAQSGYGTEERVEITRRWQLYQDVADELAVMRNLSKAEVKIPEEVREAAYEMLTTLNYEEDFGKSRAALNNFKSKIRPLEAKNVQALKQ